MSDTTRTAVLDAQVINWYFRESVLGEVGVLPGATDRVSPMIQRFLDGEERLLMDDGNKIATEWLAATNHPEWLTAILEALQPLEHEMRGCRGCIQRLRATHGFAGGRDAWYVKLAVSHADATRLATWIVTEDLDLHEPKSKRCSGAQRLDLLCKGTGALARDLRAKQNVHVASVVAFMR